MSQAVLSMPIGEQPARQALADIAAVPGVRRFVRRTTELAPTLAVVSVVLLAALGAAALTGAGILGLLVVATVTVLTAPPTQPALAGVTAELTRSGQRLCAVLAVTCVAAALGGLGRTAMLHVVAIVVAGGVAGVAAVLVRTWSVVELRVVVVGSPESVRQWYLGASHDSRVAVVGALVSSEDDMPGPLLPDCCVGRAGGSDQIVTDALALEADLVVIATSNLDALSLRRLAWRLEGTGVGLAIGGSLDAVSSRRVSVRSLAGTTVLGVASSRRDARLRGAKALADRALGLLLLVAFLPLIAVLMILVRLDSSGPALFRQVRVGQDDGRFLMYKLRTMHQHAERDREALTQLNEVSGPLFKIRNDPRVTRIGQVLRRTSLDELPQLINVVRGEMSLVGPRPALPLEVATYSDTERRRLAVPPGMTGLWQVSGRSELDWDASVRLDLDYTDNWSLSGDLSIMLRTLRVVLRRAGAY